MTNFSLADCTVEYRPLDWFRPYPGAPRVHPARQKAMLEAAVLRSRVLNPLLAKPDGTIIAGELRFEVGRMLNLPNLPVIILAHLSDAEALALRVADNAIAEHGKWSIELLARTLGEIETLDMSIQPIELGFETAQYDQFRLGSEPTEATEPVPVPDRTVRPVARAGDIVRIAGQTIACGDSRDPVVYQAALDGRTATACISDQPWNLDVDFISGKGRKKFDNFAMASGEMSATEFEEFTADVLALQANVCAPGALIAQFIDWRSVDMMVRVGRKVIGELVNICVWVKQNGRFGSPWRSRHELVCVFRREGGKARDNVNLGKWGRNRTNVWEYDAPAVFGSQKQNLEFHPTSKNPAMIADFIRDCTDRGDVVLDAFLGSGTTLLAAHNVGRLGVGIEIDPGYVDLTIRRLVELTGEEAFMADGTPWSEVRAQRLGEEN